MVYGEEGRGTPSAGYHTGRGTRCMEDVSRPAGLGLLEGGRILLVCGVVWWRAWNTTPKHLELTRLHSGINPPKLGK